MTTSESPQYVLMVVYWGDEDTPTKPDAIRWLNADGTITRPNPPTPFMEFSTPELAAMTAKMLGLQHWAVYRVKDNRFTVVPEYDYSANDDA